MATHRCDVYLEIVMGPLTLNGPTGEMLGESVVLVRHIDLPFVPVRGLELDFGVPADQGGQGDTPLQMAVHSVSYQIATGHFALRCRPAREFANAQLEIDDEQHRDQLIKDCTVCGFWPTPTFE